LEVQRNKDNYTNVPWSDSANITLQVGQTYTLAGSLRAAIGGDAIAGGWSHVLADLDHTMNVSLEPVTPGAGYTTESGASYIPEPVSLTLILLGLGAVGLRPSRRDRPWR